MQCLQVEPMLKTVQGRHKQHEEGRQPACRVTALQALQPGAGCRAEAGEGGKGHFGGAVGRLLLNRSMDERMGGCVDRWGVLQRVKQRQGGVWDLLAVSRMGACGER